MPEMLEEEAMKRLLGKLLCWFGLHEWDIHTEGHVFCSRCPAPLWLTFEVRFSMRRDFAAWVVVLIIAVASFFLGTVAHGQTRAVEAAANRHSLPPRLLAAVWEQECSSQPVCERGRHGEWGPFQIMAETAGEAECLDGWRWTFAHNADCAARVLVLKGARPGRYRRALARYNGCDLPCTKGNWYGDEVYNAWLRAEMARGLAQLLARR